MTSLIAAPMAPPADPAQTPASTTPAAYNAGYVRFTKARKGDALSIVWCAEPGDEPVLIVGYDSTRIGREMVDYIVDSRYGVPAEVEEMAL